MSRLLVRIMLALLMFPAASITYLVTFAVLSMYVLGYRRGELCLLLSGTLTAVVMATWWWLLWFRCVTWTRPRIILTLAAAAVSIPAGVGVTFFMWSFENDVAAFIGPVAAIVLWLTLSVFIWRETSDERSGRIDLSGIGTLTCARCGYNMTGLRRTTCPECGADYTIDELVAAQPAHELSVLERAVPPAA